MFVVLTPHVYGHKYHDRVVVVSRSSLRDRENCKLSVSIRLLGGLEGMYIFYLARICDRIGGSVTLQVLSGRYYCLMHRD